MKVMKCKNSDRIQNIKNYIALIYYFKVHLDMPCNTNINK